MLPTGAIFFFFFFAIDQTYLSSSICWLLSVARLYEPGRQEPSSRDTTNLLVPAEPGSGCFKYRTSLTPHLHVGNQTYTSHA
jgi:hypothetical protein